MIRNLVIISALFSICWGCNDLSLKLLRTSCDPIIFNTSFTDENINFCRDTYALIQNCLEERNTNGSYKFQSYGCALEYEFGYSEQVPYREYSNAYNWVKDHGLCKFAVKKDFVWNFDLFHDYKPNPSKCSTIGTTTLVSKIDPISTTSVISTISDVRATHVSPIHSLPSVTSILPQHSTTTSSSMIGTPASINPPISSTTTTTGSRTTTDSYKTPGLVNEENGSSTNLNDDTKMVAIVVVVCLAVVIIPTIIIAIRLIKG